MPSDPAVMHIALQRAKAQVERIYFRYRENSAEWRALVALLDQCDPWIREPRPHERPAPRRHAE